MMRHYTHFDRLISNFDRALQSILPGHAMIYRPSPAAAIPEMANALDDRTRRRHVRLLRVDHSGEVCAQALYQGQALTASDPALKTRFTNAALEERDHLAWCQQRLTELSGRTSYLNAMWYLGSLLIGITAGLFGQGVSLGFLVETERQVTRHLDDHLARLDPSDRKTIAILAQMRLEEIHHATNANAAGGSELSPVVQWLMASTSKIMTLTSEWI